MQGAEVLTKFTADTSGVDSATKGFESSLKGLTKSFTLATLASQGINKALSIMNENMDDAIKRTDILNNFPKVMSNLGIEAKEAEKSISLMSDKLIGLPTMLDEGAMAVQRFTSANGDIEKSTEIFLAVNNAILAGGANAQIQSNALEQLSQAYAKGKPDMMEWRSLMSAMPAQLKQVAIAMGYVSSADLGEALRADGGEAEFQRFIDTIVQLNTTGVEGFANFEEQARGATGGISTSVKNMKNAFVRGVADIITKTNDALKRFGGITGILGEIGKFGEMAFSKIGDAISFIIPYIIKVVDWTKEHHKLLTAILVPLVTFIATFKTISSVIAIINAVKTAFMLLNTTLLANPITLVIGLVSALVAAFVVLWKKSEAFREFWKGLWAELKPPVEQLVNSLKDFWENVMLPIVNLWIAHWLPRIKSSFELIKEIGMIVFESWKERIKTAMGVFRGLLDFITGVFTGDWSKAWEGIKTAFGSAFNGLKNMAKTPLNAVITLLNSFIKKVNKVSIPDWVPGVGGKGINIPLIPKLATGTNYVPKDMLAQIHEGEAIIPKKFNPYANPISSSTVGRMVASTPTNNIIVHNSMKIDPLGQLVNDVKTFSGGAKNDYNYVGGY